jgi:hypothetical protein
LGSGEREAREKGERERREREAREEREREREKEQVMSVHLDVAPRAAIHQDSFPS